MKINSEGRYPEMSDALDARMTRALEQSPTFSIPEGFAARLAAANPPRVAPRAIATNIGRSMLFVAIAVLLLVMVALAPAALRASAPSLALEFSFAVEFVVLVCYVSLKPSLR
ncbi:hypothetical protein [Granulicella tundricola]|uniref:Uncharacterized protein n=1 Tax=Granulicella tundricola (strain ATCC BAA-1859 / DSM 23138 / MP5ACTX9) TaxID=1198114 RepID=E8X2V6_GRATM|nr:hypothetical protein [Granulicella tundricola]ADW68090.1 hypothetical protein AciX9_1027 [Granulicella tundricola MP5ACTX9]